jgi:2,3-bisphosphoglycerate-independent phosphoglycerate mutase
MKTVMVIIDGLGDEPIAELGGKTPLASAFIPNIHYIANRGSIGCIKTTFDGFPIESMVCIMGLLGYEPERFYPSGRASFEAMAKGIPLNEGDLVLRCNTVTVDREKQLITDFTGGLIADSAARSLVGQIQLPHENWELYPGQSYRNTLIIRSAGVDVHALKCSEPHMHIGHSVSEYLPNSGDARTSELATELRTFLLDTQRQIAGMDLPPECRANMLWVWSPSTKPVWPSFQQRMGVRAAVVGGLDFLHGIAMAARMHFDVIPGATGYIDTDYRAKAAYTMRYLESYDFVLTHINATDEEAHQHNHAGKIEAIEKVDEFIVGPVMRWLNSNHAKDFRIVVCGDHTTRCRDGKHADDPVPYAIYGAGVPASASEEFSERSCNAKQACASVDFLQGRLWELSQ